MSVDIFSEHEAMIGECRVKAHRAWRRYTPSSVTSSQQCSAATFVTQSGHKAVSLDRVDMGRILW